jgi:hypothetical protein
MMQTLGCLPARIPDPVVGIKIKAEYLQEKRILLNFFIIFIFKV